MGMDASIYRTHPTEEEERAFGEFLDAGSWGTQAGWRLAGRAGHLWESYGLSPHVLPEFVPEAVAHRPTAEAHKHMEESCEDCEMERCAMGVHGAYCVPYAADTLRERLPRALRVLEERYRMSGDLDHLDSRAKAYRDFVALAERIEAEGRGPVMIMFT